MVYALCNMAVTSHMCLIKFKLNKTKIKLKIQFLNDTSHI